jgi:hypothetical protein
MKSLLIAFVVSLFFFAGCNCDKEFHCGSVSAEGSQWIHADSNDVFLFADGAGDTMSFRVQNISASNPTVYNSCKKNEFGGCDCEERCQVYKSFFAQSDSSGEKAGAFSQNLLEETMGKIVNRTDTYFYVLDFYKDINITNPITLETGDSLYISLTLGNKIYNDVYMLKHDTLNSIYENKRVFKIYVTKNDGVVGIDLRFLASSHQVKSFYRIQ